ncbi:hypothetical protein GGX14DRAFT_474776 [Mycena pura]|uniref:Yeast cell wall synthesis Kre9/Knh1-like N-terminal domain-containing protein n=1 Tax=Mycena pura TaxID=153505 RepID=A0AAD6Y5T7_9AGAR|nr:hypothetical protein GGX14DRAFT_474776 [Mycena pura]
MFPLMSLCLFFFLSAVSAAPLDSRTVFAPKITSPSAGTVWIVGKIETVTWQSNARGLGVTGTIVLGFLTSDSENLSKEDLASGFNLADGKVDITVPSVVTRTNYIIALLGDSGNISPKFTIQGLSSSAASESKTGTSTTPPAAASSAPSPAESQPADKSLAVSLTPPIASTTVSELSSAPVPSATAPPSPSSVLGSSSSLLPASSPAVTTPSPSPSSNAGSSMNRFTNYWVLLGPAALLLIL